VGNALPGAACGRGTLPRRRARRDGAGPRGGGRAGHASSGGQAGMIKINLAPPRAKKGFTFQVPSFNLGILFGILFAALVVLVGGVWWFFGPSPTRPENEIVENQKETDRPQRVIAEGLKFKKDKEELEKRVNAIETVAR